MLRAALLTVLFVGSIGAGFAPLAFGQTGSTGQDWTVELDIKDTQSPAERISALNQQIVTLQARDPRTPQLGDMYNDLGVAYAQQEQWDQARDAFIRAVQVKPYDPDFHRNLALVFLRLDDHELAIAELKSYRELGGGQALDAYRLLGQAHLKIGDVSAARAAYRDGLQAIGRSPSAEACRLALALASLEQQNGAERAARDVLETWLPVARAWQEKAAAEGAQGGLQEARLIQTNMITFYVQDALLLEEAGEAATAVDLYRKAHELAPERDDLLPRMVSAYLAAGDPFQAKVAARMARQDFPERPGPWLATARIHEAENEPQQAAEAYKRAYELAPETPGLALKLGSLYLQIGQAAEGRKYLAKIIEAADTPVEIVYNYAVSLIREQRFAAAIPPLQRVTRESPEFAGGWVALAQTYRARQQYSRAMEAYAEALKLQPDARTAYNLGVTAGQAKDWNAAITAYDQALALDPQHREAAYNRGVAMMQAGRLADADTAFMALRQQDPGHVRAHLNHGVTLYRLGRYDAAIKAYNEALEIEETAEVWDNLGLAYDGLGNKERAQQCYKEAKKLRGS